MHFFVLFIEIFLICCSSSVLSVKVSPCAKWNRTAITVVGTGVPGNSTSQLNKPVGIFIRKPANTLYVADRENNRIQMFSLNRSSITGSTVVSNVPEPFRIYVDEDNGPTIYVSLRGSNRVEKWTHQASSGVQVGTECQFCSGVSVDNEKNVYMGSFLTNLVTKWFSQTNTTTVVAGIVDRNGSLDELLSSPQGLYIERISGSLYIADCFHNRIQKWPKGSKKGITVAGLTSNFGGDDAELLACPNAVIVDEETDTIYIVDTINERIQRWLFNATEGETIAGRSGADSGLNSPTDLAFDNDGNLYVCDSANHRIQMFALISNEPCFATSTNSSVIEGWESSINMEYQPNTFTQIKRYCRRPMVGSNQDFVPDHNVLIYNKVAVSFDYLRKMGISASQLFKWYASMDVIEEYISGKETGFFFNCSNRANLWFGPHCEYTFDSPKILIELLHDRFDAKRNVPENLLSITNGTCYQMNGAECESVICLDWREICDGKIDCANGFDEQHCHELEQNECDLMTEYRCRNGHCIDKEFYWNGPIDCMDYSDEMHIYSEACYTDFDSVCEDKVCPPLFFSCGDGFCYDGPNMNNSLCKSQRDRLYYNQMSESKQILFSHITLIYNDTTSVSICFNNTLCPYLLNNDSTLELHGLTCRSLKTFTNQTYVHFDDMLKDVKRFVRSCSFLPWQYHLTKNSTLFRCNDKTTLISIHRLSDGHDDCANREDEHQTMVCSLGLPYRLACDGGTRCIPVSSIADKVRNCDDGSDENGLNVLCMDDLSNKCRAHRRESMRFNLTFVKLCDSIVEYVPDMNNDTDETDCSMIEWSCHSPYSNCNGVWNCPNGSDELNCAVHAPYLKYCNTSNHFCLDVHTGHFICLPIDQAGNGIIDCIGSMDEREFCRIKYPYENARRYRCRNSAICIKPYQVCDCEQHCPENDDETIACVWLNNGSKSFCSRHQFRCRNGKYFNGETHRCDGNYHCADGEDELFCNLIDRMDPIRFITNELIEHPVATRNSMIHNHFVIWHCNHGIHVRSTIDPPGFYCLCPNEYYGDRCQFQRKRLIIILQLRTTSLLDHELSIFKIVILLVRNTTPATIISHEQIMYGALINCLPRYSIQLLYPINEPVLLFVNHTVHIHVFSAKSLTHRISWQFPIFFEFLPVNRIVKQLIIPDARFNLETNQIITSNTNCTSCSNVSFCLGYDTDLNRDVCVCPSDRTGRRCLIPFNSCTAETCYGNGQCIPVDSRASMRKQYTCLCYSEWFGQQCRDRKARIHISFAREISFPSSSIVFIHFLDFNFKHEPRQLLYFKRFNEIQSNFTILINNRGTIPSLVFIQLYEHTEKFDYYLVVSLKTIMPFLTEITTQIHPSRRCSPIHELFNSTVLRQPQLQRVKSYQRPCLDREHQHNQLACFYDNKLMCLCDKTNHANCFNFDSMYHGCPLNKCNGRGICVQNHDICPTNSTCICDECSYGAACQFSTTGYTLSLDAILGSHIQVNTLNLGKQSTVIKISVSAISILVAVGIVLNMFATSTFLERSTHTSGSSLYLFVSSIIGIISMIMLVCKIILLLIGKYSHISCSLVEFALKWSPTCCEWLNACVAAERMVAIQQATKFSSSASRRVAKYVAPGVVIFIAAACSFELIFRRIVIDTHDEKAWCVFTLNRDRPVLLTLYSIFNIIMYLVPIVINLVSSVIIIIGTLRLKQRAAANIFTNTNKHSNKLNLDWKSVKAQIKKYKHILITTILFGLLAIPRLVLTFVYVCTKLDRRPLLILFGYLIGFLPSIAVLVAFILPAQTYRAALAVTVKRIVPKRLQKSVMNRRRNH